MKKRNVKISVFAVLGAIAMMGGVATLNSVSANAADANVAFEAGASIRVSEPSGIRFTANFNKDLGYMRKKNLHQGLPVKVH